MMRVIFVLGWSILVSGYAIAQGDSGPVELVVHHATIHTLHSAKPLAQALAVSRGRFTAVGSNDQIMRLIGPATRTIDARGKLLVPGFNDAHVHFLSGGQQLSSVQLRDAATQAEFRSRIRDFAKQLPKGTWITGGDWDHENWPDAPLPTKELIDDVTPDHPVFISRLDGHMGLANSLALKMGGVDRNSVDPAGGLIVRDASIGQPTGILKDAAMSLVAGKIPPLTFAQKQAAALAATNHAAALGVTSVQDMSGGSDVPVLRDLFRRGELKTRIYAVAPLPRWRDLAARGITAGAGDAWIREGGLKGFADGSLGSTTAFFFEPYHDDPRTHGLPSDEMFPDGAMFQRVRDADKAGLQVMVHAIGDRANDQMLTIFEQASQTNRPRDRRFRIEHAQHLREPDIARFAKLNVIASMQPYHCADDGRWAEKRIGHQRAQGTYAFDSLLDAGAVLAFGSDWNVAPLNPLLGIAAAVTRQTLDGKHPDGWIPEQKISVEQAVRAYTVGSATAEFAENEKGTIEVGKLADFVVLSQNIFKVAPTEISRTHALVTVVDGRVVYERQEH